MTHISDIMDEATLDGLIARRYVSARSHPSLPLTILNYTAKTQYESYWTTETRRCRGLVVDDTGIIVARSFEKFWNLGERHGDPIPIEEPFVVYEKLDGSLAISYIDADGRPSLATRGSFVSEQARRGTVILRTRYADALDRLAALLPHRTVLFEIIYPENRIVVDYGDRADVVLLAVLDTLTGKDLPLGDFADLGFPLARTWACPSFEEIVDLCESDDLDGQEGFVVRFESGYRVKVKREDYHWLHRLVTGTTPRRIWERLRDGDPIEKLTNGAPLGYQAWVRGIADDLAARHAALLAEHRTRLAAGDWGAHADRAAFATLAKAAPLPAVMFALYDRRDDKASEIIWKALRPAPADPFRVET